MRELSYDWTLYDRIHRLVRAVRQAERRGTREFRECGAKGGKEVKETDKDGHKYYPGTWSSVWRSAGLAEWDRHVTGKLSAATERSLRDMFERQSESGAFVSHDEVEIPHITTDFELSLQAARAITAAPGWLAGLTDETLLRRVEKLKHWLRTAHAEE